MIALRGALVVLVMTACGATESDGAPGDAGTSGSAGSAGSAATGDAGGTIPVPDAEPDASRGGTGSCAALVPVEPELELAPSEDPLDWHSDLTLSSDSGERVTLVSLRTGKSPSFESTLVMASFEPWQSWPASGVLEPVEPVQPLVAWNEWFVTSPAPNDRFALLGQLEHGSLNFVPGVTPAGGPSSYGPASGLHARFVAAAPWGSLLGTTSAADELIVTFAEETATGFSAMELGFGCAENTAPPADAEAYDDGFLLGMAHGTNDEPPGCTTGSAAAGPARRISVFRMTPSWKNEVASFVVDDVVGSLKTAPHPDGLWLVWRAADRLHWARVEATTGAVIGPAPLPSPVEMSYEHAPTALGRNLAVAWTRPGAAPRVVEVTVLGELGATLANTTIETKNASTPAIAASPVGDSVVVAWSDHDGPARLRRFDCTK